MNRKQQFSLAALLVILIGIQTNLRAAPPDARLQLELANPKIERIDESFTSVESDDESIVHAEILPSGELLLEAKTRGSTRVFLFAQRLVRTIEISVGEPLPAIDPVPPAPCDKPRISPACYSAWRIHLLHIQASEVPPLELDIETLQEEMKAASAVLEKAGMGSILLSISSFGIKLKGAKDASEERRALRAIWPELLGPMRLDK